MEFHKTRLNGAFEVRPQPHPDERGLFARTWCRDEFRKQGLNPKLVQCSVSFNQRKGTLRGMHYQAPPYQEAKLVRCIAGAVYDVSVDLRRGSATFGEWIAVVLTEADRNMIYVPEGCAHGFLTLEDRCEVSYQMSEFYHPESARGVRWDDPFFRIAWPDPVQVISERDQNYPDFQA